MTRLLTFFGSRFRSEKGIVAAEYILLVAALTVAVAAGIAVAGGKLIDGFTALNI
jgi:Flp pilus assembly pilin Flp